MKHVAIVSPHFAPSNMTSSHRARLLATYLPEFGWDPTVVTVHEKYYEEACEPALESLLPPGLRVRKAPAWPVRPFRIVGDVGVRGFAGMLGEIGRLHRERPLDFLVVTIPSNFAAPLGRLALRRWGIPYGIDYQDPWVHEWPGCRRFASKAWVSWKLAHALEPFALGRARLVTGISEAYFRDALRRHPELVQRAVTAAMPNGWSEREYAYLAVHPSSARLFAGRDAYRLVYAGAMLPRAVSVARALFEAVAVLKNEGKLPPRFEMHFVGTGAAPETSPRRLASEAGIEGLVVEHPSRLPYLEVLAHLNAASAVLVLGSTEPHYSPSKAYQAVLSGRPVLALIHEASDAAPFLDECGTAATVKFGEAGPSPSAIGKALLGLPSLEGVRPSEAALERVSARRSAAIFGKALDRALELSRGGSP